jgi:hypothetical protein
MDLRISTNPHLDPKEAEKFLNQLMDRRRSLWGPAVSDAPLDKAALEMLKGQLKNNSKAIKVK